MFQVTTCFEALQLISLLFAHIDPENGIMKTNHFIKVVQPTVNKTMQEIERSKHV